MAVVDWINGLILACVASISSRKLGQNQKRGMKGEVRGKKEMLVRKPTILKTCVCPQKQLLIGALLVLVLTKE